MKTHLIFLILASALALNGCSDHEESESLPGQQGPATDPCAVTASIEPATRTTLDIARNVIWKSGDQIRIFGAETPAGGIYSTASDNIRTGIFTPLSAQQNVTDATRYAVYPATAAAGATLSGSELTVDLAALARQPYISGLGAGADIASLPMVAVSNDTNFAFKNICGGVLFQLNDYQSLGLKIKSVTVTNLGNEQITGKATVDIATTSCTLAMTGENRTVTVDCGDGANISSGGNLTKGTGFIVFLPAGTYADGFRFSATDTEGRLFEVETRQSVTVTAGTVTPLKTLPVTLYYGTANCYRTAPQAGTIEIDATPYYTLNENFTHENRKCVDATGASAGVPSATKIVWQQAATDESGDVVSTPSLDGTTLKVPVTGKKGNAIVAVCDASDVILWSYHIWVSDAQDVNYQQPTRGTYKMLDRNLGATSVTLKDRNSYGLFYQWGRKDPFARNLTAARPTGKPYESASSDLEQTVEATAETGTIAYAVRNPQTRLLSGSDWYQGTGGNDLLWGWTDDKSGVKTVYDPCPAGYRVADYYCFAELPADDKGNCTGQYGYLIATGAESTTSYYPTGGYLSQNKNVTLYLEYRGYLWNNQPSTGPNTDDAERPSRFFYNNNGIGAAKSDYRSAAMPLRCVKTE